MTNIKEVNGQLNEKETYTPDWEFVTGSFDSSFRMLSVPKDKYKEVTISLTQQPENLGNGRTRHGFNYPIAKIKLHNDTYGSAVKVFADSTLLAEQIAKRWNEHPLLSSENAQLREALRELVELVEDIDNTLFHYNHAVDGWHLNGDLEPMMNFVADFDMDAFTKAKHLLTTKTQDDEKNNV